MDAKEVIVHTPTPNALFWDVLNPHTLKQQKHFDIQDAIKEHQDFVKFLQRQGIKTFQLVDVLLQGTLSEGKPVEGVALQNLREIASKQFTIEGEVVNFDKEKFIHKLHPSILVEILLMKPVLKIDRSTSSFKLVPLTVNCQTNIHFTRDHSIVTGRGVVFCKMKSNKRSFELEIMKQVYNKIGVKFQQEVSGEGRLVGGDQIPTKTQIQLGCGNHTNLEGIRQLMEHNVFSGKTVAVVKDRLGDANQIVLDQQFNFIAQFKCVLAQNRLRHQHGPDQLLVDEFVFDKDCGQQKQVKENIDFEAQLLSHDNLIIEVCLEDTKNFGINFLTLKENHIVCAEGISEDYKRKMRENNIKVDLLNATNLIKASGNWHSLTQVIKRVERKYKL